MYVHVKPDILTKKYFYSPYSNETFYTKALEYKQVFYTYSRSENDKKFRRYSTFSQYETQNVWPSGEYKYIIFGLCNVLKALDSPLLCEDFNGGLCFKGG